MLTPQERKKLFKAIEKEGFDAVDSLINKPMRQRVHVLYKM